MKLNRLYAFIVLLLLINTASVHGQRIREGRNVQMRCVASYQSAKLTSVRNKDVQAYASQNYLHDDGISSLKLAYVTNSKTGKHLLFYQMVNGIRLLDHFVKVNCTHDGRVKSVFHRTYTFLNQPPQHSIASGDSRNHVLQKHGNAVKINTASKVYVLQGDQIVCAMLVDHEPGNCQHVHSIVESNGITIERDMMEYLDGDTTIRVKVFYTDPLTSTGQYYGGSYVDNNDADAAILNNERVADTCIGSFNGTTFELSNAHVTIAEHSPPVTVAPTPSVDSFFHTRSESAFEDVNAFYHITRIKQHINRLGYNTLVNYQIRVDAHGLNGTDNSTFNTAPNPPELTFGEGGVDDAEDADVLVHEYTHAISHAAAPGTNSGTERQNIEEANCDYMASSYSKNINPFRWQDVYTWDGHNEYWNGRSVLTTKNYGTITFGGNIYEHTDLWAGVLMELWDELGRDLNDELLLESMHSYAPGITMQDAANLFVLADSTLYGGANYWKICPRFFNRGLLSACSTLGLGSQQEKGPFKCLNHTGTGQSSIYCSSKHHWEVKVYDVSGRLIDSKPLDAKSSRYDIPSHYNGLLILHCETQNQLQVFKIVNDY